MTIRYVSSPTNSPLIVKMAFYKPGQVNASKNQAHLDYITRDSAVGHLKYADERPGSHGLFGQTGSPTKAELKEELNKHRGNVWRMIVSLNGEDAHKLDMTGRKQWEEKMRASIPDVAEKMGIPASNLRWAAAFHSNTENPHVHIMIWEKKPDRWRGKLSIGERKDVRRVFAGEIYAEERVQMSRLKTVERDLIRDMLREDLKTLLQLDKDIQDQRVDVALELKMAGQGRREIAPVVPKELAEELLSRLRELARQMPQKGRIALKFMSPEVKALVNELAEWALQQPGLKIHYKRYLEAHEQLTRIHVQQKHLVDQAKQNAHEDLRNRLSQILLRAAAELREKPDTSGEQRITREERQQNSSFIQSVFAHIFTSIQSERTRAESESEWQKRKANRKRKKRQRNQERG